jgi:hypothetical protein
MAMTSSPASSSPWTAPDIERREVVPVGERQSLEFFLDWQRQSLLWKCAGLTGEQLNSRPLATTDLSLLGLIRHMALVERWWFRMRLLQDDSLEQIFTTEEDPDGDFHNGTADSAESDYAVYLEEVDLARQAAAGRDLDKEFPGRKHTLTLRWIYLHMIEEYARHNGHADLLREAIDGVTGE